MYCIVICYIYPVTFYVSALCVCGEVGRGYMCVCAHTLYEWMDGLVQALDYSAGKLNF